MKKLFIIAAITGIVALTSGQSNAQVSLNVNIGTQPAWVPAGYQNVNYYYLPEVNAYYDVPQRQFVYLNRNSWIRSRSLPARYEGYNLYRGRKVVVYGNQPYRSYYTHRVKYARGPRVYRSAYGGGPRLNHFRPRRGYNQSFKADKRHHNGPGHHGGPRGRHGRH